MTRKKVRKLLAVILSFIMIMTMLPGGLQPMKAYAADDVGSEPELSEGVYQITSAEQLKWFADKVNSGQNEINGKLMNDIDLSQVCHQGTDAAEAANWTPIGNKNNKYSGTFDGNGKKVSGLYIDNAKALYQGLFGYVGENGNITNIGVEGVISGEYYIGGVAGNNAGTVSNCYNTGNVSGSGIVGGVAGNNDGTVSNCYNTGSVNGNEDIGGVAGNNEGTVSNCYNTGSVNGNENIGGVAGNNAGTVSNCYYLLDNEKKITGIGKGIGQTIGKTADEFESGEVTYLLNKYLDDVVWYQTLNNKEYPTLDSTHCIVYKNTSDTDGYTNAETGAVTHMYDENGICTYCGEYQKPELKNGEYQIKNAGNLAWFSQHVASGYNNINAVLINDIALSSVCHMETVAGKGDSVSWLTIGSEGCAYSGTFDGNGKKVSGLYIHNTYGDNQGLFGYVGANGNIENVGVAGKVNGCYKVGGVAGYNSGTVSNCYNIGSVSGNNNVGGVVGKNSGTVSNSYNVGDEKGDYNGYHYVGGVVGNNEGTVNNCYNTGSVSEASYVGGIAGYNSRTVSNCYYLNNISDIGDNHGTVDNVVKKTEEQFKLGEVAYLLNGAKNIPDDQTVTWYQKLGTDQSPVLTSTGDNKVYYGYASLSDLDKETKTYTNKMVYEVTITCPEDSHMTRDEKSGEEQQKVIGTAINPVTYIADDGYYFPENYVKEIEDIQNGAVNGISITRESAAKIVISGTPLSEQTEIKLIATTEKGQQQMSEIEGVNETLCSKNDGKITGTTSSMEYKLKEANTWTKCTDDEVNGLAPGTYEVRISETDTLNASDSKEINIAKGAHKYIPFIIWDGYNATAKLACEGCKEEKENAETVEVTVTSEITKESTCEAEGVRTYTATAEYKGETYTDTKTEAIPAKGHTYGTPVITWNGYEATAKVVCSGCKAEKNVEVTVTSEITKEPTCEAEGVRTYTATAEYKGETYTDTKTEAIPAKGHTYGTPVITWNGYEATAKVVCSGCKAEKNVEVTVTSEITKEPTCEAEGVRTYTATAEYEGEKYTDTKTEAIPAKGHTYGPPVITWNGCEATAKVVCSTCESEKAVEVTVTSEITKEPTYEAEGVRIYTATAEYEGKTYKDTKTETVPKLAKTDISVKGVITVTGVKSKNYTGKSCTQTGMTVKAGDKILKSGTDYTVSYENNKKVGKAVIKITGMGEYTGTYIKTFSIKVYKGKTYTVNGMKYKVTNADVKGKGTVTLTGTTKKTTDKKFTSLEIGKTADIGGVTYKITAVGSRAFKNYTKLKKVTIGANVTEIGKEAFSGCKSLKNMTIASKKLKKAGTNAIKNISKIAVIKVPKGKAKAYKKLFNAGTGYKKTMKIK